MLKKKEKKPRKIVKVINEGVQIQESTQAVGRSSEEKTIKRSKYLALNITICVFIALIGFVIGGIVGAIAGLVFSIVAIFVIKPYKIFERNKKEWRFFKK